MARHITHTLVLEGQLVAQTPIHIGGADSGDTIDMPLATNGKGQFYIPGTSLAGAIRAWEDGKNESWGYAEQSKGHASFIIIDDAPAEEAPQAELWHGVGIDRKTGGAFEGVKFDRQVLPQGTRFSFRLQREVPAEGDKLQMVRIQMQQLKQALEAGDIPLGGSITRGFGRLKLEKASAREIEWESRAGILEWLRSGKGKEAAADWESTLKSISHASPIAPLTIAIHWQPRGPLMSKAAQDGIEADMLPFISRTHEGKFALTLPGSAIKGALRQQAERIIRTVLELEVKAGQHFDQVDVPLVKELFGSARGKDETVAGNTKSGGGARALLSVDSCYSQFALLDTEWRERGVKNNAWSGQDNKLYKADHVAIDRWTGGASDGALFNTVEPDKSIEWEPIRLRYDLKRGKDNHAALALLWLVLRDLGQGRIPLGFGVNRGYGDLSVERVELRGVQGVDAELSDPLVLENDWQTSPLYPILKQAWADWLQAQTTEVA